MALLSLTASGIGQTVGNLRRGAARVNPETVRQVERETILLQRDLLEHSLNGPKGSHPLFGVTGASGNTLGSRSGHTRRSVVRRVFVALGTVIGAVGSPLRQMKLHEDGGTVSGKPYLRIPTREMQTASGQDRLAGQKLRGQPGMFLFRSANGRSLWAAFHRGNVLVLAYLLVRQIRLRARHIFRTALRRNEPGIRARMNNVGLRVSATANGGA